MRPIVIFLVVAGAAIITWLVSARPNKKEDSGKPTAITVSKHSDSFNHSIGNLLNIYLLSEEQLVKWDSISAREKAIDMEFQLTDLKLDELKKDSSIYLTAQTFIDNAKGDAQTIASEKGIRRQREAFNSLTDNLRQFLNTVKYDREKLYLQECPMAFDDTKPGQWLSRTDSVRNPYLGLHDPQYGRGMLHCGETKATINHTGIK